MRTHNYTLADIEHFAPYFAVLRYDPAATRRVHFQASSFFWSDEMPVFVEDGYEASIKHFMIWLLSYRKVLMYGQSVPVFAPLWNRLQELCPDWPGFRCERAHADLVPELEQETQAEVEWLERAFRVHQRREAHRRKLDERQNAPVNQQARENNRDYA